MISFTDKGIYCVPGDFYIDPWKPVHKALITHGHSDHARWGSDAYLCHHFTVPILHLRLGKDIQVQGMRYNEPIYINGVAVSFHPAGHIIGSAQIRMEYKGEVWCVSGDYKLSADQISTPFELVKCHHFVTESTFGLPVYHFKEINEIATDINQWCSQNAAAGYNSVLLGYALGKAQVILHHLEKNIESVYLHGAVANVNEALQKNGLFFRGTRITPETDRKKIKASVIVAPPSAAGSPWLKSFEPYRIAMCSGWMALRGARRRYGTDKGFVLSDHCDWDELNKAVIGTGAENIYVTHGYETSFAKWLREQHGLNAQEVNTLYSENENADL